MPEFIADKSRTPESSAGYMPVFVFLFAVVFLEQDLFYLIPWANQQGSFDASDIGLGVIFVANIWLAVFKTKKYFRTIRTPFGVFITLLFWMIFVHIGMASMNYDQTIFDGFVGARIFFHFGIFFVFLYFFQDMPMENLRRFLDLLTILAVVAGILTLVNNFVAVIFYHPWAHGHGFMRFGAKRAFAPGINIMTLCTLWCAANFLNQRRRLFYAACTLLFFGLHVLTQERGRLIGLSFALLCLLIYRKRFGLITVLGLAVLLAATAVNVEKNVFVKVYSSVFEELEQESGTWKPRLEQAHTAFKLFAENPVFGTGTSAIRITMDKQVKPNLRKQIEIMNAGAKFDLGYISWLRDFGLFGVFLVLYYYLKVFGLSSKLLRHNRKNDFEIFGMFCMAYFIYIVVSSLTHNHFSLPQLIYLNCLYSAALIKVHTDFRNELSALRC